MLCVIKLNRFTKAFPRVDLIIFLEERVIREQPLPIAASRRTSLVAGWTHQWASEVSGNEGTRATLTQIIPFGGPQMGPKSTPFFM